jgi:hypothetical protein
MNTDELELRIDVQEARTNEFLQIVSKKYKLPIEIIQSVYAHCVKYPEIKDMTKDKELRKIWTKKYERNEEVKNSVEIVPAKVE